MDVWILPEASTLIFVEFSGSQNSKIFRWYEHRMVFPVFARWFWCECSHMKFLSRMNSFDLHSLMHCCPLNWSELLRSNVVCNEKLSNVKQLSHSLIQVLLRDSTKSKSFNEIKTTTTTVEKDKSNTQEVKSRNNIINAKRLRCEPTH